LRDIIPEIPWTFVDSNIYPDFVSNAKAAMDFVQARLNIKIDAVISMDYYTVARILGITGPLPVPGYAVTLTSDNFIKTVIEIELTSSAHKATLGAIAGPLMARVSGLPPDRWPSLIEALNTLAAQHHLQVYFADGLVEREIDRVGWSGGVNPTSATDFLMEIESNYSGNKVNYYLSRHYSVALTRNDAKLHHKVIVDLVNATPAGLFARPYIDVDVRLYVGALASSTSSNLRPVKYANPPAPAGTKLIDGWLPRVQCCGDHGQAVLEYDTPWSPDVHGVDHIYWEKQPGTVDDRVDFSWTPGNGSVYKLSSDLGVDRVIALSSSGITLGIGQPAQAALPSLSLG
jgi:hypothetical protein